MTESKVEKVPETAKELLALNPEQESVFKQKVQEAKKNKSKKVSNDGSSEPSLFMRYVPSKDLSTRIFSVNTL